VIPLEPVVQLRLPIHSILVSLAGLLGSCTQSPAVQSPPHGAQPQPTDKTAAQRPAPTPRPELSYEDLASQKIQKAEAGAAPGGRAVLAAARQMIAEDKVVKGACWDYANAVYARAGFGSWKKQSIPFKSRTKGPYADPRLVRAGDWLYIINHPATLATHSVIFVHWVDAARREALVVTYVGGGREDPGYYRQYDVSRIFQITRPKVPTVPKAP
jgi:hypothetical protein